MKYCHGKGRRYHVIGGEKVVADVARQRCRTEFGTDLATVIDTDDYAAIREAKAVAGVKQSDTVFVGLHLIEGPPNDKWAWDDGTPCQYENRICIASSNGNGGSVEPQWANHYPTAWKQHGLPPECVAFNSETNPPSYVNFACYYRNIGPDYIIKHNIACNADNTIKSSNGKCLDIENNSNENGVALTVRDCDGGVNQQFFYDGINRQIKTAFGKCLDVPGPDFDSHKNGAIVQLWDCHNRRQFNLNVNKNQEWHINGQTITDENGKCLDLHYNDFVANTNGGLVQVWDCNDGPHQQWDFQGSITHSAKTPGFISYDDEDDKNVYIINISQTSLAVIACMMVLLLIVNMILLYNDCYCNKKKQYRYNKINYAESETDIV